MQELSGKVAVITGAASGFGREFARLGASLGMRLALADVEADTNILPSVELRMQDILMQRDPSDPYTYKPEVAQRGRQRQ